MNPTIAARSPQLAKLISELASDCREAVSLIENKFETTQDHYGDYMSLISSLAKDERSAKLIAMALIEAGANREGVLSAMKVMY